MIISLSIFGTWHRAWNLAIMISLQHHSGKRQFSPNKYFEIAVSVYYIKVHTLQGTSLIHWYHQVLTSICLDTDLTVFMLSHSIYERKLREVFQGRSLKLHFKQLNQSKPSPFALSVSDASLIPSCCIIPRTHKNCTSKLPILAIGYEKAVLTYSLILLWQWIP